MGETTYRVVLDLSTRGNLGAAGLGVASSLGKAEAASGKLMASMRSLGAGIMGPLDAVASRVMSIGVSMAKWGMAAALGGAVYSVGKLNSEFEQTQISLAAMFNANKFTGDMKGGMDVAAGVMAQMRKDAADLPGEFKDLLGVFRTAAVPAFRSGMGIDELRDFSAKTMAFGAVSGLNMEQVAREMAMLLEGRAGAHNVLGLRLGGLSGGKAEEFNKLGELERVKILKTELDKFAPAIEVYKGSFYAMFSTAVDEAKQFVQLSTEALSGRVKGVLTGFNKWFTENKSTWSGWAAWISDRLVGAFDAGLAAAREWGPPLMTFAENLYAKITAIWRDSAPLVGKLAEMLKSALADPGTIDRLASVAKMYVGLKAAGAGLGVVGAVAPVVSGVAGLLGGGGAAAVGVEAVAGGTAAAAAGGTAAAAGGAAALGTAATVAAPLLIAVAGAVHSLADTSSWASQIAQDNWALLKSSFSATMTSLSTLVEPTMTVVLALADVLGIALLGAANIAMGAIRAVALVLETAFGKSPNANIGGNMAEGEDWYTGDRRPPPTPQGPEWVPGLDGGKHSKHGGGGGGTNVQKVEIVVTSNQSPSRIARLVMHEIENLHNNPRISRAAPRPA